MASSAHFSLCNAKSAGDCKLQQIADSRVTQGVVLELLVFVFKAAVTHGGGL